MHSRDIYELLKYLKTKKVLRRSHKRRNIKIIFHILNFYNLS